MIGQLKITKECDELVKVTHTTTRPPTESTTKSGYYPQEQAQQAGAIKGAIHLHLGHEIIMDSQDNGGFAHEDADVTMWLSYMLQAVECGKDIIRIHSDDTDVFVLMVYWVWKMQFNCSVQMDHWNGVVLNINATCTALGPKCLQLLAMHALSGCDTVSYTFNKGKLSALNVLKSGDFPRSFQVLGEEDATYAILRCYVWSVTRNIDEWGTLQDVLNEDRKAYAHHGLTSYRNEPGSPCSQSTPSDDAVEGSGSATTAKCGHHKVWLRGEGRYYITLHCHWITRSSVSHWCYQLRLQSRGEGWCSTERSCSCHKNNMSCTVYCAFLAVDGCCNPFTMREDGDDDQQAEYESRIPYGILHTLYLRLKDSIA